MKPAPEQLMEAAPDLDERCVHMHLQRLSAPYFDRFDSAEIIRHIRAVQAIRPDRPAQVRVNVNPAGHTQCTVCAYNYPAEFSLIAGILSGTGFSILSGEVFTYRSADTHSPAHRRRHRFPFLSRRPDLYQRRCIIDVFSGTRDDNQPLDEWQAVLTARMTAVIQLLEQGNESSVLEARQRVNEMVTRRLADIRETRHPVLYPVRIDINPDAGAVTRLHVESQDTPAFLYALSNALALQDLSIEHVRINTTEGHIKDEIDLVNAQGHPISDPVILDRIKWSVLLTKQFTYFLDRAPSPYHALARFEQLVDSIQDLPSGGKHLDQLANPHLMQDLARLLGASDYLWEDFLRLQYEELLPILEPHVEGRNFSEPAETIMPRLQQALAETASLEKKKQRLNAFKDRELFLIDLDHILVQKGDFKTLSAHLTALAEAIVRSAAHMVYEDLARRYGHPSTAGGLRASYAVLGLGKFGGVALGYGSDIELLFVYNDNGATDGEQSIGNAEFFSHLVRETARSIQTPREGIFRIDLRLRPYGDSGPLACSLESFCRYYGSGGPAHSYERLALIRMRAVGGDAELGQQVERLRDEYIYSSSSIDLQELRDLRMRQFEEKNRPGQYNAKFSPGALVDLEYTVQIMQVMNGIAHPALRTPRIHQALEGLRQAGVMGVEEAERLNASYDFLRRLINGLRMLRGTAQDLFLPDTTALEFIHLARRMGYERSGNMSPEQQLHLEFETRTAAVRAFVERHLGRESLPGTRAGNVADLVLADGAPDELCRHILEGFGFHNPSRAYINLKRLAGNEARRDLFAKLAVLACDILHGEPDPDMALNNWERFVSALEMPDAHFKMLLSQPQRLRILLSIFSRSQFLAESLIQHPDLLDWITSADVLNPPRRKEDISSELRELALQIPDRTAWCDALRRLRRREILRIGTRDICLKKPVEIITGELSDLADVIIDAALRHAWQRMRPQQETADNGFAAPNGLCIFAMGKLGGRELNYSSDIDLVSGYEKTPETQDDALTRFSRLMRAVRADLSDHTGEGCAYRVDLRLRPYGSSGAMVSSFEQFRTYYTGKAAAWEIQALLKCRPVAGDLQAGRPWISEAGRLIAQPRDPAAVYDAIRKMRDASVQQQQSRITAGIDVKTGIGGLRDIEFLVQGLQLIHAHSAPDILTGHTLTGLERLRKKHFLAAQAAAELSGHYRFMRRIEHCLQIMEDQQIHALPQDARELTALARRVMDNQTKGAEFLEQLDACRKTVRAYYREYMDNSP